MKKLILLLVISITVTFFVNAMEEEHNNATTSQDSSTVFENLYALQQENNNAVTNQNSSEIFNNLYAKVDEIKKIVPQLTDKKQKEIFRTKVNYYYRELFNRATNPSISSTDPQQLSDTIKKDHAYITSLIKQS